MSVGKVRIISAPTSALYHFEHPHIRRSAHPHFTRGRSQPFRPSPSPAQPAASLGLRLVGAAGGADMVTLLGHWTC